jgi:hypothetical protein
MKDKKIIYTGLALFLIVVLSPIWYNLAAGKAAPPPEPKLAKEAQGKQCVMPKEMIRVDHMQLLDDWRDTVTRDGRRIWVNASGQAFNMSLSNTCLGCHTNKKEFCDTCHTYVSANPYCWDCHIDNPKGEE